MYHLDELEFPFPSLIVQFHLKFEELIEAKEAIIGRLVDFLVNHMNEGKETVSISDYYVKGGSIAFNQRYTLPCVENILLFLYSETDQSFSLLLH